MVVHFWLEYSNEKSVEYRAPSSTSTLEQLQRNGRQPLQQLIATTLRDFSTSSAMDSIVKCTSLRYISHRAGSLSPTSSSLSTFGAPGLILVFFQHAYKFFISSLSSGIPPNYLSSMSFSTGYVPLHISLSIRDGCNEAIQAHEEKMAKRVHPK